MCFLWKIVPFCQEVWAWKAPGGVARGEQVDQHSRTGRFYVGNVQKWLWPAVQLSQRRSSKRTTHGSTFKLIEDPRGQFFLKAELKLKAYSGELTTVAGARYVYICTWSERALSWF